MKSAASSSRPSTCRPQSVKVRVADPGVAVVPVALAAGRLRQRGGQRRDHAAGRGVDQPLQGQRRALQLRAPAVVGEAAAPQPLAPALRGLLEQLLGLIDVGGQVGAVAGPAERQVAAVAGRELAVAADRAAVDLELEVGEQVSSTSPIEAVAPRPSSSGAQRDGLAGRSRDAGRSAISTSLSPVAQCSVRISMWWERSRCAVLALDAPASSRSGRRGRSPSPSRSPRSSRSRCCPGR